jgi:arginase family enzyme
VALEDAVLVGARNLDPPEETFIAESGLWIGTEAVAAALEGTEGAYVAFDCDVLDASEAAVFMPEPDGMPLAEAESFLAALAERTAVLGAGLSGLRLDDRNVGPLTRLTAAMGL